MFTFYDLSGGIGMPKSKIKSSKNEDKEQDVKLDYINLGLPEYLLDAVREKANKDQSTIRYEIMRGLRRVGYEVRSEDMVKDARRGKFVRKKL